ncbi:MAG: Hsp20/alpha crystallin family protein [Clostridia bacterium]|nr:Hsp20/alpha crystallin family protein [Clostridia bacterium]
MSNYLPTVFGENLMDVFDDFDRAFFRGFPQTDRMLYGKNASRMMKTDVKETEEGYELDVELPGFKKDEIKLELNNGYLTISTEKSLDKEEKTKQGKVLRQERYSGAMQRSFYVGGNLSEEDVKAKYENGVLSLTVPKKEARKIPEKKQILIEG